MCIDREHHNMSNERLFEDCFNMVCGRLLHEGVYRKVYECKLRPDLVVKVEEDPENGYRNFHNVKEWMFWEDNNIVSSIKKWLAPIEYISPDARILLQKKVKIVSEDDELPKGVPAFLTDLKRMNFGWLEGRLVCVDYALTITNPSMKLKKANWD